MGARYLADALKENTVALLLYSFTSCIYERVFTQTLIHLNVENNRITAVGAQHLADALSNNTVILI